MRLSPFHSHRVFQVLVGETLAGFVKRLRLERELVMMAPGPRLPIPELAAGDYLLRATIAQGDHTEVRDAELTIAA